MFYWTKWLGKLIAVPHSSQPHPDTVHKDERVTLGTLASLVVILCILFPIISADLVRPVLVAMFHTTALSVITRGDVPIMLLMMCMIVILPIAARLLTLGKQNKPALSYMAGVNDGDDRSFIDSFGEKKQMYLANWYFTDLFGEKKILKPCLGIRRCDNCDPYDRCRSEVFCNGSVDDGSESRSVYCSRSVRRRPACRIRPQDYRENAGQAGTSAFAAVL